MSAIEKPVRPRVATATAVVAAVLLTGAGAAAAWALVSLPERATGAPPAPPRTTAITRGTLSEQTQVAGTLLFDQQRAFATNLAGVVTALPAVGEAIGVGGTLYAVNSRPVTLLRGTVPAWRDFEPGMKDGADVQQLESNLHTMGLLAGLPDGKFTATTSTAIRSWQKTLGQERTGVVERGSVVFAPADLRVSEHLVALGAEVGAGTEVLAVSARDKVVQTDLKLADQQLAVIGDTVSVSLPDGTTTEGTVAGIGVAAEREQGGGAKATAVPVTITLADQAALGEFQRATVTVGFNSERRENALTVPVDALLALSDTNFGLEIVERNGATKRVPVTTGLFAAGRVEISGPGIAEGLDVVVPER